MILPFYLKRNKYCNVALIRVESELYNIKRLLDCNLATETIKNQIYVFQYKSNQLTKIDKIFRHNSNCNKILSTCKDVSRINNIK